MSRAGGTVVGGTEDRRQSSLVLPEDEDADGHQGVGEQRPDGHEVHQRCQVEQEGHHSCREEIDGQVMKMRLFKFSLSSLTGDPVLL